MEERLCIPTPLDDAQARLAALSAQAREDIKLLVFPKMQFPYKRQEGVIDVAIIGAGQTGKCVAFGLKRMGVQSFAVFDRNPKRFQGPWRTFARNHLLRTGKDHTGGMEWGIPSLHFVRWSEAKYGAEYFNKLKKIPRLVWADYLDWFSDTVDLPIEYESEVQSVVWDPKIDAFELTLGGRRVKARFVVMCTGIESAGSERVPDIVKQVLPPEVYGHTMSSITEERLRDKYVVVIGGGASAFDTANFALYAGARKVDLLIRRNELPGAHRVCWGSRWVGYQRHYIELQDELKWAYSLADLDLGVPPPRDTYYEAIRDPRFTIYTKAGIDALAYRSEDCGGPARIIGTYGGTPMAHDFMVLGTGSNNQITQQRELDPILPYIRLWKDVYVPSDGKTHPELEASPYLGQALQFMPKDPQHQFVERMYYLCSGVAHLSGFRCNLSAVQFVSLRVCHDISRQIFLLHRDEVKAAFDAFALWE